MLKVIPKALVALLFRKYSFTSGSNELNLMITATNETKENNKAEVLLQRLGMKNEAKPKIRGSKISSKLVSFY